MIPTAISGARFELDRAGYDHHSRPSPGRRAIRQGRRPAGLEGQPTAVRRAPGGPRATQGGHPRAVAAAAPERRARPSPSGRRRRSIARLRLLRFRAYLDGHALGIADTTGRGRDVSRFIPANELFRTLVAGLDADPALLDSEERQ